MPQPDHRAALTVALLTSFAFGPSRAQAQTTAAPAEQQSPTPGHVASPTTPPGEPGFTTQMFSSSRTTLLADMFGLRSAIGNDGLSFGLEETSEVLGNVTGGVRQGADYDGLTIASLGLDTQKAFGWSGGTFNVSALQIHGRDLAIDLLDLQTPSGIEANRATRLWELWFQQTILDGRADVKLGQQSLDQEFIASTYAGTFINTMMGWPVVPSYDLYAGGPAYPLSSLGVRLRVHPSGAVTVLAGAFDDNPGGGPFDDDSQVRGAEQSGMSFNLNTGALFIAEIQLAVIQPAEGDLAGGPAPTGLPGTYKLGAWFDTGSFPDQRFANDGLSLADPGSNGIPRMHRHDYSLYAVADQMVWRPDPAGARALGLFLRIMGAPDDRNLIDFGLNAGLVIKAPLSGRDNDSAGLGYGLARVSSDASGLDRDTAFFSATATPIRSSESFIELTYQAQIAPWWQVQPDIQYVFMPGAGAPDPAQPTFRLGNETILGVRTNITF